MNLLRNAALVAACALLTTTAALAGNGAGTTAIVTSGTASFSLDSNVVRALYNQGVSIAYTDMTGDNSSFNVATGVLGIRCGHGEVTLHGGLLLTQGGTSIEARDWQYEAIGDSPFVTAMVIQNGIPVGRIPIFAIERQLGITTCSELATDGKTLLSYGKKQPLDTQILIDPDFARGLVKVFKLNPMTPVFDQTTPTVIGQLNFLLDLTSAKILLGLTPTE
jgi:hypothetical protein